MILRPLFTVGFTYLAATAAAFLFSLPWWSALVALAIAFAGLVFSRRQGVRFVVIGVSAAVAFAGVMLWQMRSERLLEYVGKTQHITGIILDTDVHTRNTECRAQCRLGNRPVQIRMIARTNAALEAGKGFSATVTFSENDVRRRNDRGIVLAAEAESIRSTGPGKGPKAFFIRMRQDILNRMDRLFREPSREIIQGMMMGERGGLSMDEENTFVRTGAVHLLVVSGFHISLAAGFIYKLLCLFRRNQNHTQMAVLPFILFLAFLTGMTVPVIRASIMCSLYFIARPLECDYDPPTAWAFSALLILLFQPYQVMNAGFLLSFGASLGICFFAPAFFQVLCWIFPIPQTKEDGPGWIENAVRGVSCSLGAQLILLPMLLYFFGYFSWISPVASLITAPFIPPMFLFGTMAVLTEGWFAPAASLLAAVADIFCKIVYWLLQLLARLNPLVYAQEEWMILWFLILYGVMALLYWRKSRPKEITAAILSCALIFVVTYGIIGTETSGRTTLTGCRNALVITQDDHGIVLGTFKNQWDVKEVEKVLRLSHVKKVDGLYLTLPQNRGGEWAQYFCQEWKPRFVAAQERMSVFDSERTPYQVISSREKVRFWKGWTIEKLRDGRKGTVIIRAGNKKFLKTHEKYGIMADMVPQYTAVFGEEYLAAGNRGVKWKKTWSGQWTAEV